MSAGPAGGVVERYLATMVAHDWDGLADCVAADVERIGPFGDRYRGRADYVAFLAGLLPTLPGYRMDVDRIIYGADGRTAAVELSETVLIDGEPLRTDEGLLFDLDGDGRIRRVAIYVRTAGPTVRLPGLDKEQT